MGSFVFFFCCVPNGLVFGKRAKFLEKKTAENLGEKEKKKTQLFLASYNSRGCCKMCRMAKHLISRGQICLEKSRKENGRASHLYLVPFTISFTDLNCAL